MRVETCKTLIVEEGSKLITLLLIEVEHNFKGGRELSSNVHHTMMAVKTKNR